MNGVVAVRNARTVSKALADLGQRLYTRGWVLGTSGNFSEVVSRRPLRLAITASGLNKRTLRPSDILTVDGNGKTATRRGRPSAETLLHVTIARLCGAGAVLHTHSVWSTILSDRHAGAGGFHIEGYEMLKGLHGVTTHEHREWIPIRRERSGHAAAGARFWRRSLDQPAGARRSCSRRHGLYTWGGTLDDAERHVEILEFLFETMGRRSRTK